MKITNVRACQPVTPQSPPDWRSALGQILVAVDTDSGITGYGVGGGGFAGIHVVQTVLRDLLLGQRCEEVESLWRRMHRHTLAYGQKGIAIMAISGVDLALWDLRGKAEAAPVHQLLGGLRQAALPTYATVWSRDALAEAVQQGHQGYKLHLEHLAPEVEGAAASASSIESFAEAVQGQVAWARQQVGPERKLMADAWMQWTLPQARAALQQLAPHGLSWLEEPLPIDDQAGYEQLTASSSIPIAGGEHEYTPAAFRRLAERRLHDVLQPDVCWCGGLTALVRIYQIGAEYDLRVCPHRGAEIWSLHAMAALDPDPLAETGRAWMTWVRGQPPIVDGQILVPQRPGLGLEIDEAELRVSPAPVCRF